MKKSGLILFLVFIISCKGTKTNTKVDSFIETETKTEKVAVSENNEFKVMVWNILHGGHDDYLPKDGRPDVIDIIKQSKADVILMIETYGSAPMIAEELGFNYELLSSNLCIFSRFPIRKKITFKDQISTFNFGGVEILINEKPIVFFDTWLHYLPDTRLAPLQKTASEILAWENKGSRDNEIISILKTIQPYLDNSNNVPVIIGGDFNSHSHLDWTESTKNSYNHGGAVVNWTISKKMMEAGFKDAFRTIHPDPLKNIGTTWLGVRDAEGTLVFTRKDRIDYMYNKGEALKVIASENGVAPLSGVFNYKGKTYTNFPSDHGFVLTTFKVN